MWVHGCKRSRATRPRRDQNDPEDPFPRDLSRREEAADRDGACARAPGDAALRGRRRRTSCAAMEGATAPAFTVRMALLLIALSTELETRTGNCAPLSHRLTGNPLDETRGADWEFLYWPAFFRLVSSNVIVRPNSADKHGIRGLGPPLNENNCSVVL